MFKRLMVMLLLVITGSLFVIPARAADGAWTAWLYDAETGQMTQVDSAGATLHQFQLPIDAGSTYSQHVAISADGLVLAYATSNANANSIQIYNMTTNNVIYTFDAPANSSLSIDFAGGPLNFSETHEFAFGYGGLGIPWKIIVIDIARLSVSSLKQEDPAAASLAEMSYNYLPVVAYNRNKEIKFMMIPMGTDGVASYKAFTWNRDANTISPTNDYVIPDVTTFVPTGDVLSAKSDDRFPDSRVPFTDFPANNTLQVFDPASSQYSIVTTLPRISNPQFIQSGERIAVTQYDDNQAGSQTETLQVLERSGAVSGIVNSTLTNVTGVLGTPNGFIFSVINGDTPETSSTTLYTVETRQASAPYNATPIWNSAVGVLARLTWVSDSETPAGATATFTAWGHVDPPVLTPTPVAADNTYAIGIQAAVQTTNNDVLNLRNGPGINFDRLGTIPNGTIVTLIDGPQNADGFIWWRVRLPTGVEGWVVTEVDGVTTLILR